MICRKKELMNIEPSTPEFWIMYRTKMAAIRQKQEDLVKKLKNVK